MMLQAEELGIGSTWIMHFDPEKIMKEFDLPEYFVPVCLLAMGYPSETCKPAALHLQRKELKETVFYK